MARRGLRAARRPLTALAAPVRLPSGTAGAGRGGWSIGDAADVGAGACGAEEIGLGVDIGGSGPVERVSGGATVGGMGDAGGAGGAASGEAIDGVDKDGAGRAADGVANGAWPISGMPRLTGVPIPAVVPVVPVVPASASGAGVTVGDWNWGVGGAAGWPGCCCPGAVGWSCAACWSGGACWSCAACWYPAAGAG
jgi:hypothetical protein